MANGNRLTPHLRGNGKPDALATGEEAPQTPASPSPMSMPVPFMLDFESLGDEHWALPYTSLLSVRMHPSKEIVATFSTHIVTIRGINLRILYKGIVRREIATLKAVGDRLHQYADDVVVISEIRVAERKETNTAT